MVILSARGARLALQRAAPHASELDEVFVQFLFLGLLFVLFSLVPVGPHLR